MQLIFCPMKHARHDGCVCTCTGGVCGDCRGWPATVLPEQVVELLLSAHVRSCPFASSPAHLAKSCMCCWLTCLPCVPSAGVGGEEVREGVGLAAHCWTAVSQVCMSAATNQLFTHTHATKQNSSALQVEEDKLNCGSVCNRAM